MRRELTEMLFKATGIKPGGCSEAHYNGLATGFSPDINKCRSLVESGHMIERDTGDCYCYFKVTDKGMGSIMQHQKIKEAVRVATVDNLGNWDSEWDENITFADMGTDSLLFVEIIMALEEELCFEFSDDDCTKVKTPADLIARVEDILAEKEKEMADETSND